MSLNTAFVVMVKHSSSVSARFLQVMLLHCGYESNYITVSATSVGFANFIVWSLVGDEFSGFTIVAVKAYVPLRVACLDIMLWPMGTWFPEC
jgi:hypothetical protein